METPTLINGQPEKLTENEREQMAEENIKFVYHISNKYKNSPYQYEEIVSAGMLGMTKALKSFNPSKGIKFTTYCGTCITNEILLMIRKEKKHNGNISLETKIYGKDDSEFNLLDILVAPEEEINWSEITETVRKICKKQKVHQQEIFSQFLEGKKQREIADNFNLSRTYISKIIGDILKKIKAEYWRESDVSISGKREGVNVKIDQSLYNDYKAKGMTDKAICEKENVSVPTLINYKKKWKQEGIYEDTKKQVADAVSLDENLEKALRLRITELEYQATEFPELVRKAEKLEAVNMDLTNEKNRLLISDSKKSIEIKQLKDAATDLEEEIDIHKKESIEWKQKAQYYASENEGIINQYQDMRNALESQSKEIGLYRALLKEVL